MLTGQDLYNEIFTYCMSDGDNVRLQDILVWLSAMYPGLYDEAEAIETARKIL